MAYEYHYFMVSDGVQATIKAFEADPDFTLRSRIEALAEEIGTLSGFEPTIGTHMLLARLRELLAAREEDPSR